MISLVFYMIAFFVIVAVLNSCIVITRNKTVKMIEFFGKFSHCATPGLSFKLPAPFQLVAKTVNTNIYPLHNKLNLKTKDNLFISYPVTVQVKVLDPVKAAYELDNPNEQIISYISNLVRTEVGKRDFLELYGVRDEIQHEIQGMLSEKLSEFGFEIINVLVDEPEPSEDVRNSYDAVTKSKRLLEAAANDGMANKLKRIAEAEAEKESKKLQGEGLAAQRNAIAQGFSDSVEKISTELGVSAEKTLEYMLILAKYDTIRDSSNNEGSMIIIDTHGESDFTKSLPALEALNKAKNK